MKKRMTILKAMLLSVAMFCSTLLPADLVSAAEPEAAEVMEAEAIDEAEVVEEAEAIDEAEVIEEAEVTDETEAVEATEETVSYEEEMTSKQDAPAVKYKMVYGKNDNHYDFTDINYGSFENYQMSFTSTKAGTYLLDFNFWDPDYHYAPNAWWFGWADENGNATIPLKYINDNGYYSLTKMYITMKANETIYLYWEFNTAKGCDGYVNISYTETIGDAGPQVYSSYNKSTKTLTLTGEGITWDTLDASSPVVAKWKGKEWNVGGDIEHLVIGEGITRIGEGCFFNGNGEFNKLKDIDFPTTLDEIGNYAFGPWNNGNKVELELPYGLHKLETCALCGLFARYDDSYTNKIEIEIPESVDEMGYGVFTDNLRQVEYITLVSDSDYVEQWANKNGHPFKHPVAVAHTMTFKDGKSIGDNTYEISMKVGETYPIAEHVLFDGKVMKTARYYAVGPILQEANGESKPGNDYAAWNEDYTALTAKKAGTIYLAFNSKEPYMNEYGYNLKINITAATTAPAKTTISSLTNTSTGITVKWSKVSGVTGYVIYRSDNGGSYKKIGTAKGSATVSYADTASLTNGTKYQYKVRTYKTVNGSNVYSGYSAVKTSYRLTRPTISSLTNAKGYKMTVKYGKNAKATGYQIQYSTSKTFESGVKTVKVTSASTVSKTISSLTKNKTYYVRVRAYKTVSGTNYYSAYSATKNVKITK
ncbi:MAG: fibronectin type III domain-containing protein [Dorea sp.]|nr:fibronectin type III domain-containing protein [Dorea sp.]